MAKKKNYYRPQPNSGEAVNNFKIDRIKNTETIWNNMYTDQVAEVNRFKKSISTVIDKYKTLDEVKTLLEGGIKNRDNIVNVSNQLYAINPLYANVINYLSNMYLWRYKVTPHLVYKKGTTETVLDAPDDNFINSYSSMLETVDGIGIENIFPMVLSYLFINGIVYFTTLADPKNLLLGTIILPDKYCKRVGSTQYGTNLIQFDFSYFDTLGLSDEDLKAYLSSFPDEFSTCYQAYLNDNDQRWGALDPRFSSCLYANDYGMPPYIYLYKDIVALEQYETNELERNSNLVKSLVVQKIPVYQNQLIFEQDEVKSMHNSMRRKIEAQGQNTFLTTYGDMDVLHMADPDSADNNTTEKALKALYRSAGFNPSLFESDSVEGIKIALIRDKGMVWNYVQQLSNFYTIAVNNQFDFKQYQADIEILRISPYTYNDDIEGFKNNATLGVGKLDFIIASGIKQKNIRDTIKLEDYLGLNNLKPMQTSYTQNDNSLNAEDVNADPAKSASSASPATETKETKESADASTTTDDAAPETPSPKSDTNSSD